MFMWAPFGLSLSLLRTLVFLLLPYNLSIPIGAFSGLLATCSLPINDTTSAAFSGTHHLYVCNHRTLLDPIYISAALNKLVTAVTYSLSPLSELLAPIPTVRLTRNKEVDRKKMEEFLKQGDLVVCPEGTTCREPYLLRFSPLFAELTQEVVPVALDTRVSMFYGTTASGFKWLDPFCFLMNPNPKYELKFLDKIPTGLGGGSCSYEVANEVQREIGLTLGFECTSLTRKHKYLMLAGNEGTVENRKPKEKEKVRKKELFRN
ncbi:uncharacterized protein A4U43_C07F12270 [Asparagus officinalis]|uniref:Phospholipid/glycerol acyltransferase domain-containing protein n=1 Tax=Asparagus officinalis TaxID=4686 RepID=A0A5P1EBJ1_ASPOF|nr:probable glycerol-3-phosphate acyltransferase 2 [Asparagus officinalis]ONK63184.1 uncharacterized protein A4U43_C07F12270 [Asparagus officinalis]